MAFNSTICKWDVLKPLQLNFVETVKMISIYRGDTGDCALLVTFSGEIYAIGQSEVGCLGLIHTKETSVPLQLKEITEVEGVYVCGRRGDALAYTSKGKLFTWGSNSDEAHSEIPTTNSKLLGLFIVDARCVNGNYLALCKDGKIYQWRGNGCGGLNTLTRTPTIVSVDETIVGIDCGLYSSLALTEDGEVYRWGKIYSSTGVIKQQPLSKITITGETVVKVICNCTVNLVLTDKGRIFTWGRNPDGLGDSNRTKYSEEYIQVGKNIGRFVDIAVNNNKTCAAATDYGVIFTWGYGENMTATFADYSELHEVFMKYSQSNFLWKSKTSDSIDIGFTTIAEKLKACFNNEENSDLIVKVDNKKIYLHRFILNIQSEYFRTFLQDQWTDKNLRVIELRSFNHDVYTSYFWYLYSGEIKSLLENLLDLWNLANAYNEDNLKLGCEKMMRRNLSFKKVALQYCKAITKRNYDFTSNHEYADEGTANLKEKLELLEINLAKQQQENENLKALLRHQENADESTLDKK